MKNEKWVEEEAKQQTFSSVQLHFDHLCLICKSSFQGLPPCQLTIQHRVCLTPRAKYTLTSYCAFDYTIFCPVLTINIVQYMSQGNGFDSQ